MASKTGSKGLGLIEEFEGYHTRLPDGCCQAYLDKLPRKVFWSKGYKGLWTIGFGSTGPGITKGTIWTRYQAERNLRTRLKDHERSLNANQKLYKVSLDQNQYDALISASWNLGQNSTLIKNALKHLAAGNENAAADVFLKYNKAGNKVYRGLVRRRAAERKLFLEHTTETLRKSSRKLTWAKRIRDFITSLGIGTYLSWDMLTQVREFATDNAAILLLIAAVIAWLIFKAFEKSVEKDHKEGRYVPSGDDETLEGEDE